jgi:TrmH family RNA methyltransferase
MLTRVVTIHSANDTFQQLVALSGNRRKRHQSRRFLVEGVKPINLAIAYHWDIDALVYAQGMDLSVWAREILTKSGARARYELSADLMEALSGKEETSEIIAVVTIPEDDLNRIRVSGDSLFVILDQPGSPGNLGAVIRSCDAFRANGVVVLGHSADVYDPQTIRASIGTVFSTPTVRIGSHSGLLRWLDFARGMYPNLQIVGSSAKADTDISGVDLTRPTALVLGNETSGMNWNLRQACDFTVRIPIYGAASSLNLACAASILLYEVDRQRRTERS